MSRAFALSTARALHRPARLIAGNVRKASVSPANRPSLSSIAFRRPLPGLSTRLATSQCLRHLSSSTAIGDETPSQQALASLQVFFEPGSPIANAQWHQRIQEACQATPTASSTATIISLGDGQQSEQSLLSLLLQDALVDHTAQIPQQVSQAALRAASSRRSLAVQHGTHLAFHPDTATLTVPVPWLKDAGVNLQQTVQSDLDAETMADYLYTTPQVLLEVPFTQLTNSLTPPEWLEHLRKTLQVFGPTHQDLTLVVTHSEQFFDERRISEQIQQWVHTPSSGSQSTSPSLRIHFVDVARAQEAQQALRKAMGFDAPTQQSVHRSDQWAAFQHLSLQSGLPTLVKQIQDASARAASSASTPATLPLLLEHAEEQITSTLLSAEADLESIQALCTHLDMHVSLRGGELQKQILNALSPALLADEVTHAAGSSSSNTEPVLLPKWWKLPFIGDGETRLRIQERLEQTWLGGDATEQRLIWWNGRLTELHAREQERVRSALDTQSQVRALPASVQLQLRHAASSEHDSRSQLDSPTHLSLPVQRARDHLFGRDSDLSRKRSASSTAGSAAAAGYGALPSEGGTSILDDVQRRVQPMIYRFYTTLGLSYSVAIYGLTSHLLSPQATPTAFLTHSHAMAIAALGTTYAVWSLQRHHSRLTSRLLTRDLLTRIPANVYGEVSRAVASTVQEGVYGNTTRITRVLDQAVRVREEALGKTRRQWERRRRGDDKSSEAH